MPQDQLHFEPEVFRSYNGNEVVLQMNEAKRIDLIIKELQAIYAREEKRNHMYLHFPYEAPELLLEAIELLEKATEWGEPSDGYLTGEPPLTADEMHTAAWKQHQELHS
jgi:hypothetical protein